jgi:TolA-binding protein
MGVVLFGWLGYRSLRRTDDPTRLVVKWALTALVLGYILYAVVPTVRQGGYAAAFGGIPMAAVGGILLAIIWGSNVGAWFARPLESLFLGSDTPQENEPHYSIAESLRKKGNYMAALAAIQVELARFPHDFRGRMMLAEVHAVNRRDLDAARAAVQEMINDPASAPEHVAFALNHLSDWELQLAQDPDAARAAIEQIIQRYPDTELAQLAHQRLAHLPTADMLHARQERVPIALPQITDRLGLCQDQGRFLRPAEEVPEAVARLEQHLAQFPLDWEAREELARIYAESLHQVERAAEQYDFLLAQPNQPAKKRVQWFNQLADVYIRQGNDLDQGRDILQRMIDLYPGTAAAEVAHNRLMRLKIELNAKKSARTIKLGPS